MQTELMRRMRHLCLEIGERHLGSDGERRAADWLEAEFRAAGLEVERQPLDAPGWRYGSFSMRTLRGGATLPCFPCFYSCGGAVEGEPVFLDLSRRDAIVPDRYAGRIVIAHGAFETVQNTNLLAADLDRAGALALVMASPYQDTWSTKIIRQPGLRQLVVMTVSKNTALDLARLMKHDGLRIELDAENFTVRTCNVIARSRDTRPAAKRVVISAHYDTAPGIQGAGDDASGIAALLTLAGRMQDAVKASPYTAEWIAFTGEEYGANTGCGYGASHYANTRAPTPDTMAWMVSLDNIGSHLGRMQPAASPGGPLVETLDAALAPWALYSDARPITGCDVGPFSRRRIPTVFFSEAIASSGNAHFPLHSPRDNLDLINPDKLEQDTRAIEACLLGLARGRPPKEAAVKGVRAEGGGGISDQ